MSLIDLYNARNNSNTYVGRVKQTQTGITTATQEGISTDAVLTDGLNAMDAFRRSAGGPDEFQTEFKRNKPGAYRYDGDGKVPGTGDSETSTKNLTKWTSKAWYFAFTDPAGNSRKDSLFTKFHNKIGADHKYTPSAVGNFKQFSIALPTAFQQQRATKGTPPPSPAGLNG